MNKIWETIVDYAGIVGFALFFIAGIYTVCFVETESKEYAAKEETSRENQIDNLLIQGGGVIEEGWWHIDYVLPKDGDSSDVIAFYARYFNTRHNSRINGKVDSVVKLEVLQINGKVYKRVLIGAKFALDHVLNPLPPHGDPI